MDIVSICICIMVSLAFTFTVYCVREWCTDRTVVIEVSEREPVIGDVCLDLVSGNGVLYCGDVLCWDNEVYALVVYTVDRTVYCYCASHDSIKVIE